MIKNFKKILVIAPHLDDETIALGGTIKRLTKNKFNVCLNSPICAFSSSIVVFFINFDK